MKYNKLANIKFKNAGKTYYFSTNLDIEKNTYVVVETSRGLEMGIVTQDLKCVDEFDLDMELKPIKRIATKEDIDNFEKNISIANEALHTCKQIINEYKLDMRLINCEYTLDRAKVIFNYTAEDRVDFRELLRELATVFRCRIELRQIGTRDKAKLVGGIGVCGMPLCCSSSLNEFTGVSINMAKNQMLAINIEKISGMCGRLMCCLKYEDAVYSEEKKRFPKIGEYIIFEKKDCKVIGMNVINDLVKIDKEGAIMFVPLKEIKRKTREKKNGSNKLPTSA